MLLKYFFIVYLFINTTMTEFIQQQNDAINEMEMIITNDYYYKNKYVNDFDDVNINTEFTSEKEIKYDNSDILDVIDEIVTAVEEKTIVDMKKNMECYEKQLSSKQDYASVFTLEQQEGENGNLPTDVIVVFDGHGHNIVIDIIRNENLLEHFAKTEPTESIQCVIDEKRKIKYSSNKFMFYETRRSGATCSFAKIYRNEITKKIKIVAEWVGDSPILIFVNGELVFHSEPHSWSNEAEIERLKEKGVFANFSNTSGGFYTISSNRLVLKPGKYVNFTDDTKYAITRSLGHNRITGVVTQKHIIECSIEDEVKVIAFSDGVDDVIHMDSDMETLKKYSAKEIVDLAESRWKQIWYVGETGYTRTIFETDGYDDCCCAVWEQKKTK